MNTQELIDRIVESRQTYQAAERSKSHDEEKEKGSDQMLGHLADMLDTHAEILSTATQKVRVVNQPEKETGPKQVTLEEKDLIMACFDDLEEALCSSIAEMKASIVEAVNTEKSVTVTNHPEPQEIEIPEKVTASVVSMPKYVSEGLDRLYKAIKALELNVNVAAPNVSVEAPDFDVLETRLSKIESVLEAILRKETVEVEAPDFTGVESSLASMLDVLAGVRENTGVQTTQTFKASWDKSFDMKSKDMDTVFHYLAHSSGNKVVDMIDVTDENGTVWRRTFDFDTDGDTISASKWTQQA